MASFDDPFDPNAMIPPFVRELVAKDLAVVEQQRNIMLEKHPTFRKGSRKCDVDTFKQIKTIIHRIKTVVIVDIENHEPPHLNGYRDDTMFVAVGKPDAFDRFSHQRDPRTMKYFIERGSFFTFVCSNRSEEADLRLTNVALEIARMAKGKGIEIFIISSDRGFTTASSTIEKRDPSAVCLVLHLPGCTANDISTLTEFIDIARKKAVEIPPEARHLRVITIDSREKALELIQQAKDAKERLEERDRIRIERKAAKRALRASIYSTTMSAPRDRSRSPRRFSRDHRRLSPSPDRESGSYRGYGGRHSSPSSPRSTRGSRRAHRRSRSPISSNRSSSSKSHRYSASRDSYYPSPYTKSTSSRDGSSSDHRSSRERW